MYFKEPLKSNLLAALRSNDYDQTVGNLRVRFQPGPEYRPAGFCCLGVACHVVDPNGFENGKHIDPDFLYLGERENVGLPFSFVNRWTTYADVPVQDTTSLGQFILSLNQTTAAKEMMPDVAALCRSSAIISLSDLNDAGATFNQIADFIESHC